MARLARLQKLFILGFIQHTQAFLADRLGELNLHQPAVIVRRFVHQRRVVLEGVVDLDDLARSWGIDFAHGLAVAALDGADLAWSGEALINKACASASN